MLDQLQRLYKYRIQFSSDTKIGYINVTTVGNKADAINLFLKHCRLQHPSVIDCKLIGVSTEKNNGGGVTSYNDLTDLPDLDIYETKEHTDESEEVIANTVVNINKRLSDIKIENETIHIGDHSVQFVVEDGVLNINIE